MREKDRVTVRARQASYLTHNEKGTAISIRPGFTGGGFRTCQWIDGEPSRDDSCKCGKPAATGSSYCDDHLARAYRPTEGL